MKAAVHNMVLIFVCTGNRKWNGVDYLPVYFDRFDRSIVGRVGIECNRDSLLTKEHATFTVRSLIQDCWVMSIRFCQRLQRLTGRDFGAIYYAVLLTRMDDRRLNEASVM